MGWYSCCKKHLKNMIKELGERGYKVGYSEEDTDERLKCQYPDCKSRANCEVYTVKPETLKEWQKVSKCKHEWVKNKKSETCKKCGCTSFLEVK